MVRTHTHTMCILTIIDDDDDLLTSDILLFFVVVAIDCLLDYFLYIMSIFDVGLEQKKNREKKESK